MNLQTIPRPLIITAAVLGVALVIALVVGITRPAPPPVAIPAAQAPAPTPAAPAAEAPPMPMPTPSRSQSAPAPASDGGTGGLGAALRPPAIDFDAPEATEMRSGHIETVQLNSDPDSRSGSYVTVLHRESRSGSQSTLDGPAARAAASIPDSDGVSVAKRGYAKIEKAGEYAALMQSEANRGAVAMRAQCVASIGGVAITRAAPGRVATANIALAPGWHEVELQCARLKGTWTATFALRAPGAEAPEVLAFTIPQKASSEAEAARQAAAQKDDSEELSTEPAVAPEAG
jgi:hypothetical protein